MTHPITKLMLGLCAMMAATLIAGIVWAMLDSNVIDGMRFLTSDRWGVVTLLDVYAGVIAVAIWIWLCERSVLTWLLWVTAMLLLGHLVSVVYILLRVARGCDLTEPNSAARRLIEREETSS